jgi:hypothetical protein
MALRTHVSTLIVGLIGGALGASLVGGAAYAVNGGYLKIGTANTGTLPTTLTNNSGIPLSLNAKGGQPPLKVNSKTRVANLNADKVDGIEGISLALAAGKVAYVHAIGAAVIDWDGDTVQDSVVTWATCPAGSKLTGGGYDVDPGNEVLSSSPYSDNSWYVVTNGTTSTVLDVYAMCYNPRGSVPGGTSVAGVRAASVAKAIASKN